MNWLLGVGMLVLIAITTIACEGMLPIKREVVRDYCDTGISYTLWKQESGYWINIHVGPTIISTCSSNPSRTRAINLSQKVSSIEEADRLIEKYQQAIAEKLNVRKQ